jgi:nicotinamide-nucleotide amidase
MLKKKRASAPSVVKVQPRELFLPKPIEELMEITFISTGDEILLGEVVDTNTAFAANLFYQHGFKIRRHHTCGDKLEDLVAIISHSLSEAEIVICCGGLGPTQDDRTAEAVANVCGLELEPNQDALIDLMQKLTKYNVPFTENQARQAHLPKGAGALINKIGTAPGFVIKQVDKTIICLPGPPREYRQMLESQVLPLLLNEKSQSAQATYSSTRLLKVIGKGEGWVANALGDLEKEIEGLTVGFRAALPEIQLKLRAQGSNQQEISTILDQAERLARDRLGKLVYAVGDQSLAEVLILLLAEQNKTLAVAESCTGGLVGKLLTDVAGASSVFSLSAVTYSNEQKENVLHVDPKILENHGAVSQECAQAMAAGVRKVSGADIGISVTGIAGPEGGTRDKPVGTVWFGLSDENQTIAKLRTFPPLSRDAIRMFSAYNILNMVRLKLLT